jgi:hypothetical protein
VREIESARGGGTEITRVRENEIKTGRHFEVHIQTEKPRG